jgi:hypothetical protein
VIKVAKRLDAVPALSSTIRIYSKVSHGTETQRKRRII